MEEFLEELALIEDELFGSVNLAGPTLQSLMPSLPASRRRMDSIGTGSFRSPTSSTWRERQTVAPTKDSTLAPTSASDEGYGHPKRKRLLALLLATLALPLALWLALRSPSAPSTSVNVARRHGQRPEARAAPGARVRSAATASVPATFELSIDSVPAEALVSEGGVVLGHTPLSLVIDRESVATKPRRLLLRREGYAPYAIEQRDSDVPGAPCRSRWSPGRAASPAQASAPQRAALPRLQGRRLSQTGRRPKPRHPSASLSTKLALGASTLLKILREIRVPNFE